MRRRGTRGPERRGVTFGSWVSHFQYVYYTAAGVIQCQRTEEQIQEHPAYHAITKPSEGRPRLAGALYFMVQQMLDKASEKEWFSIIDNDGQMTTLRPSAIFGYRVLEPLGELPEEAPMGFRHKTR